MPHGGPFKTTKSRSVGRVDGPFALQVVGHGGKERGRHRHQALVATFALGDEDPTLAEAEVLEPEPERLVSTETTQQHGFDDGPVTSGPQCSKEGGCFLGIEDPRQTAHSPHQGCAPQLPAVAPGRQAPWHRVDRHRRVGPGQQIAIEGRDRGQAAHDRCR